MNFLRKITSYFQPEEETNKENTNGDGNIEVSVPQSPSIFRTVEGIVARFLPVSFRKRKADECAPEVETKRFIAGGSTVGVISDAAPKVTVTATTESAKIPLETVSSGDSDDDEGDASTSAVLNPKRKRSPKDRTATAALSSERKSQTHLSSAPNSSLISSPTPTARATAAASSPTCAAQTNAVTTDTRALFEKLVENSLTAAESNSTPVATRSNSRLLCLPSTSTTSPGELKIETKEERVARERAEHKRQVIKTCRISFGTSDSGNFSPISHHFITVETPALGDLRMIKNLKVDWTLQCRQLTTDEQEYIKEVLYLERIGAICMQHSDWLGESDEERQSRPCQCPQPTKSIFRMPESVIRCDMNNDVERELAFEEYMAEVDRVFPLAAQVVRDGCRRKYGSDGFTRHFSDWGKKERNYPKEYKDAMNAFRARYYRHCFTKKHRPTFYFDWRATYSLETIPQGELTESLEFSEQAKSAFEDHIANFEKNLPVCTCQAECSMDSGCPCFSQVRQFYGHQAAVIENDRLRYLNGFGLLGMDGVRSELTFYEKKHPPYALLCNEKRCGCSKNCSNKTVLKDGCNSLLAIVNLPFKGLGLVAVDEIPRGGLIGGMGGEILLRTEEKAKMSNSDMHQEMRNYYKRFILSADNKFNNYRFCNSGCKPNAIITVMVSDRTMHDFGVPAIHARERIREGDQIEIFYGHKYWEGRKCMCGYDDVCISREKPSSK